jgi:outer membrane protein assembly factor BamE (lipoprotein component of BamABCDE complex)
MRTCVILLLLLAGCSVFVPKETLYLRSAEGATYEEVRRHLGTPTLTGSTPAGEPVWVYEVYQQEPGSQQSWAAYGSWCDEYVLTFDQRGQLRQWTHKVERHGGEMSPTFCVLNGYRQAS